jgi:hypothetical protein
MNIALTAAVLFGALFSLGCITQPVQQEYTFEDGLAALQDIEDKYALGSITTTVEDLGSGRAEIVALQASLESYTQTRDIAALNSLIDFRLAYLDVQQDSKVGYEIVYETEATCANAATIRSGISLMANAVAGIDVAAEKFRTFRDSYPEYLSRTTISSSFDSDILQTQENLGVAIDEAEAQLQGCE